MVCSAPDACGRIGDKRAAEGHLVKRARVGDRTGTTAQPRCWRKHSDVCFHPMFTLRMCACSRALGRVTRVFHTTHRSVTGSVRLGSSPSWAADLYQVTQSLALAASTRAQTTSRPPLDKGDVVVVVVYVHYEQSDKRLYSYLVGAC